MIRACRPGNNASVFAAYPFHEVSGIGGWGETSSLSSLSSRTPIRNAWSPARPPGCEALGLDKDPSATVITCDMSAAVAGGMFVSSTVDVGHARFLTASQAEQFDTKRFLSSPKDWDPAEVE